MQSSFQHMGPLIKVVFDYGLEAHLLTIAGCVRLLSAGGSRPITVKDVVAWLPGIPDEAVQAIIQWLIESGLARQLSGGELTIDTPVQVDDLRVQRWLEWLDAVLQIDPSCFPSSVDNHLYWTPPPGLEEMSHFRRLDILLEDLIKVAWSEVLLVAPYYSVAGVERLGLYLEPLCRNRPTVRVVAVVDSLDWNHGQNRQAMQLLCEKALRRLDVYVPRQSQANRLSIHAKFMVVDGKTGFLGSANFSHPGLSGQLELGIRVTKGQASQLRLLVRKLIQSHYLSLGSL